MKVLKDKDQSLLFNYFGREGRNYLVLSILTFFAFDRPEQPLKESELWPFVQNELGKETIFDAGMPKLTGEVLLRAKCFAPDKEPVRACPVSFRLGPIEKTLNVFGRRRWLTTAPGLTVITDPEPFSFMDLNWSRAFGGPDFPNNPLGKGFAPILGPGGLPAHELPNIEDPNDLIGLIEDRPDPAGFMPLDLTWPQRAGKLGTYDQTWLEERWPGFPFDLDWTFFNTAPPDQILKDSWFKGDETFVCRHLHPEKEAVSGKLPTIRSRCFLLQKEKGRSKEYEFKEINSRIDTVWLFPHAERGVTIRRAVAEVEDDEAADIKRIFLATEPVAEEKKPLEHYHEEMEKRLDRTVKLNLAPLDKAKKKLKAAMDRIGNLDKEFKKAADAGLGKAPVEKMEPADHVAASKALIAKSMARLEAAEARLAKTKAKFGHVTKIDTSLIARAKEQLTKTGAQIEEAAGKAEAGQAKIAQFKADFKSQAQASLKGVEQEAQGVDIEALFNPPAKTPWQDQAFAFVNQAVKNLRRTPHTLDHVREHGFSAVTIKRAWLGFNPEMKTESRAAWGLEVKDEPTFEIPPGIVVPQFEGPKVVRVIVLPDTHSADTPATTVEGSREEALVLGGGPGRAYVRADNELEAWLLHQELDSLAGVAALADPAAKPPKDEAELIAQAPQLLVAVDPGSLSDPDKEIAPWKALNPAAEFLDWPRGRRPLEAKQVGQDLRQWVLDALKPGLAPAEEEEEPTKGPIEVPPVPLPDIKAIVADLQKSIKGAIAPYMEKAKAQEKELPNIFGPYLEKAGVKHEELVKQAPPLPKGNPFNPAKVSEAFQKTREGLQNRQSLTPEIEKNLAQNEAKIKAVQENSAKLFDQGMAKIEAAKKAAPIPDEAKAKLAAMGVDLDDRAPLTRETVIERHAAGQSLARKNLSGLDLSGLDLSGLELAKANLEGTVFAGTNLTGANLSGAIANGADFSGAVLASALMTRGLFQKGKFKKADLKMADLTQALLGQADFSEADFSGGTLDKALFEETKLNKAKLNKASIQRGYFLKTEAGEADFSGANLTKAIFHQAQVPEAKFAGAALRSTLFNEVTGGKNKFTGADMYNSRALDGTTFPDSDFSGVTMAKAFWRGVDLSGADFQGGKLEKNIFEKCNMTAANLARVPAKGCSFTKSDLTNANLRAVNLFKGSLRKTRLVNADLSAANLYGVEILKTVMGDTKLRGANLKMTRIYKREDLLP